MSSKSLTKATSSDALAFYNQFGVPSKAMTSEYTLVEKAKGCWGHDS